MTRVLYTCCLLSMVSLTGCSGRVHRPDIPRALNRSSEHVFYDLKKFDQDYTDYKKAMGNDLTLAQRLRDSIINRIRVDMEMNYRAYESALFIGRARSDTAWDFLEQGLTFASTVSNGERAKTVLSAVLSGVKGTRLSIDKNFFREKTVDIIISKMQASRDRARNLLTEKMAMSPLEYPFEEAWVDLTQFFYAGTLQSGIQALAADAAADAGKARQEVVNLDQTRISALFPVADSKQRNETRLIRSKYNEMFRNGDVAAAKRALKDLGVAMEEAVTNDEIWKQLDAQVRAIFKVEGEGTEKIVTISGEQITKLKKALGIK